MEQEGRREKPVEELTVGDLFSKLKVSHAWAILGIAVALIFTAGGIGYKLHGIAHGASIRTAEVSEMKKEFFTRYNRYITTRDILLHRYVNLSQSISTLEKDLDRWEEREDSALVKDFMLARKMMFSMISTWWSNQNKFEGSLYFQPEVIRKEYDPTKSRVQFADGSEYVIPPEIKLMVLEQED